MLNNSNESKTHTHDSPCSHPCGRKARISCFLSLHFKWLFVSHASLLLFFLFFMRFSLLHWWPHLDKEGRPRLKHRTSLSTRYRSAGWLTDLCEVQVNLQETEISPLVILGAGGYYACLPRNSQLKVTWCLPSPPKGPYVPPKSFSSLDRGNTEKPWGRASIVPRSLFLIVSP